MSRCWCQACEVILFRRWRDLIRDGSSATAVAEIRADLEHRHPKGIAELLVYVAEDPAGEAENGTLADLINDELEDARLNGARLEEDHDPEAGDLPEACVACEGAGTVAAFDHRAGRVFARPCFSCGGAE